MRVAANLLLLAAALALGACGGGGDTVVEKTTVTKPASTTSTETASTSTSPASTSAGSLKSFRSPTGNIGCQLGNSYARCDIRDHTWTAPPKPADCELDWGNGLSVSGSGQGGVVCAGDTALDPSAPVLEYGQSSKVGSILCASRESGITCTKQTTGHGFTIAREDYQLF
jgi:hypothetical protein